MGTVDDLHLFSLFRDTLRYVRNGSGPFAGMGFSEVSGDAMTAGAVEDLGLAPSSTSALAIYPIPMQFHQKAGRGPTVRCLKKVWKRGLL